MHKSISVFLLAEQPSDYGDAKYLHPVVEESRATRRLFITSQVYRDMGSPETITVTIEPDDQLNEGNNSNA
jgi:hypothetical protein